MSQDNQSSCPRCGQLKTTTGKGSLTQWVVACRCDVEQNIPASQGSKTTICSSCGKKIADGREGSLTQWVLRSDLCGCKHAIPSPPVDATAVTQQLPVETTEEEEEELKLDADGFPIERYKPLAEVGLGSSGQVYRCRDRLLGKIVAVKSLRMVTLEQLLLFHKEAKATSVLRHGGVVSVLDFGATASGAPYMVMEYVHGISLQEHLNSSGPLAEPLVISIFAKLAETLAYVHEKKILHRDLKSSNVLLSNPESSDPEVKIIDFGVAKVLQSLAEPTLFLGRTIVGTPAYMPPDQTIGEEYDERSEIYSLGCMMFEALTGQVPFVGKTSLETLLKHANEPIPSLSESSANTNVSPALESIVHKCLAKNKASRFPSMRALQSELCELGKADLQKKMAIDSALDKAAAAPPAGFNISRNWLFASLIFITFAGLLCVKLFSSDAAVDVPEQKLLNAVYMDEAQVQKTPGDALSPVEDKPVETPITLTPATETLADIYNPNPQSREMKDRFDLLKNIRTLRENDPGKTLTLKNQNDEVLMARVLPTLLSVKLERGGHYTRVGIASLRPLAKLRILSVEVDALDDGAFEELCQLSAVRDLTLEIAKPVSASQASRLKKLPKLSALTLRRASQPGAWAGAYLFADRQVIPSLKNCRNLRSLHICNLAPKEADIKAIAQLPVSTLIIEEKIWPANTISNLQKMTELKTLDIRTCPRGWNRESLIQALSAKLNCELVTFDLK